MDPEDTQLPVHWVPINARHHRLSWWEKAYMLGTLAFLIAFFVLLIRGHPHRRVIFGWGMGAFALVSVIASIAQRRKRARTDQWLRSLNYRVCPECLYDLSATPSPGRCSECGTPFLAEQMPGTWQRIEESWKKNKSNIG